MINGMSEEKEYLLMALLQSAKNSLATASSSLREIEKLLLMEEQFNTDLGDGTIVRGGIISGMDVLD